MDFGNDKEFLFTLNRCSDLDLTPFSGQQSDDNTIEDFHDDSDADAHQISGTSVNPNFISKLNNPNF